MGVHRRGTAQGRSPHLRQISQVPRTESTPLDKSGVLFSFHASGEHVLKMTPLNTAHRAAGARMVDFGGWDMPVNYGSQIEEHHAVRNDCGMFDVSHMLPVDLTGT